MKCDPDASHRGSSRLQEFINAKIFDLQAFFDAATETGIWLNARPGPYINAEVSGGGFPGVSDLASQVIVLIPDELSSGKSAIRQRYGQTKRDT